MKQAESSQHRYELRKARDEKFVALMEEDVADVVNRPEHEKVLPSLFIHKIKCGETVDPCRSKARFFPLGCCDPWKA